MKIIVRTSDNVVIYGTNDNTTTIEVVNNNLLINGVVIATNVNESEYDLIEDYNQSLIEPFYVGSVVYYTGTFAYSTEFQLFLEKTHNCLSEVRDIYYLKSQDPQYSPEEKQSFIDYYTELDSINNIAILPPTFEYPTPPDEMFPYYPSCSL